MKPLKGRVIRVSHKVTKEAIERLTSFGAIVIVVYNA